MMKSTKQPEEKALKSSAKRKAGRRTTNLKKSSSSSRLQHANVKRRGQQHIGAKDELDKKYFDCQERGCSSLKDVDTSVAAATSPSGIDQSRSILFSSAKIKLQLFPLDERIQMGLEKDGHNPYLELTLSAQKKISSVLKHLNNKWGSSAIAFGDPVLFPFNNKLENLPAYKCWTLKDSSVNAGDVHAAVGCPAIFRLRYGWLSTLQKNILIPPSNSLACTQPDVSSEGCDMLEASTQHKVTGDELKAFTDIEQPTVGVAEELPPADPSNTEGLENGVSNASGLWVDSFSNISIAALLSEESLLTKGSMLYPRSNDGKFVSQPSQLPADSLDAYIFNHLKSDQQPEETTSGFQPSLMVADSLDAFINDHPRNVQELKYNKEELQPSQLVADSFDASVAKYLRNNAQESRPLSVPSSILDAEETCHSFAFKKPHSSEKEFLGDGTRFFAALSNQDLELKSHNSLKATEACNDEDGSADHKPELEAQCSRGLFNEESSLGFSKINWTDSMGPFDISLTSQHMVKDDSISLSEFVR